ncbi:hypothetical protein SAMN02745206_01689 [Desulfacinum infernum DSM 9756]|uniref:Uncharacterized protein n=1 Tax=Desulfacinum infernum DSM 9756 TaxID=1121391 RepID=A0A1M5AFB8_9BACT|nr:hypothetical protein [Desulfacinum infernum]SHF28806.1 hypothetical protein SAMN02745206_01689 [Desulfacinum infernum DSM 9756]
MFESSTDAKKKISQMLVKLGEGYIQMGATRELRENYLRTLATAWNIACLDPKLRAKAMRDAVSKFIEANPGKEHEASCYEEDMKKLIQRKLKLFPRSRVQVVDVKIFEEDDQEKVAVLSLRI